jgi:GNAT superfamily N-acetyltransferase
MELITQKLNKNHIKKDFDSGHKSLDNYIKTQAKQDESRDLSACFVLPNAKNGIIGYYTLSSSSIDKNDFPEDLAKKLPYNELPTILLGRLAVDRKERNKGFGEFLLMDALNKCFETKNTIGALAVVVDPIDATAENFYQKYGFQMLPGSKRMFIPMKTIEMLMS